MVTTEHETVTTATPRRGVAGPTAAAVKITHYADPFCWWSWGLEPVLARLREVYGSQLEIEYRMGGMADSIEQWQYMYAVDEEATVEWIKESVQLTGNPVDMDFIRKTGTTSSYPSNLAYIAAARQDRQAADRFFRRMLEAFQVQAMPDRPETYRQLAEEVGLDGDGLLTDMWSEPARSTFAEDRAAMRRSGVNFLSLEITSGNRRHVVESLFNSPAIEEVIDRMVPGLAKRSPADILEYLEKTNGHIVTGKEIAEVFQVPADEAREKLAGLVAAGAAQRVEIGVPDLWAYRPYAGDSYPQDVVRISHVSPRDLDSSGTTLETLVGDAVQALYTSVANSPEGEFHFPVGRRGAEFAGYAPSVLDRLPVAAVESFAGVGNPFLARVIAHGATVVDIGSGSGTDVLVASDATGPDGRVFGIDVTPAMLAKAERNAAAAGVRNVTLKQGAATSLPLDDASADVVTSNGVLNLVVDKPAAFAEIHRVLRPGGWLQVADIVSDTSVAAVCGINPQLWADCIGGAATEGEFLLMLEQAGFDQVEIIDRRDYFSNSSSEATRKVTKTFGARSAVFRARKPAAA